MERTEDNWKEIEENNKLIATFLGYEYIPYSNTESYPGWRKAGKQPLLKVSSTGIGQLTLCRKHRDLLFHKDWNWMMYVVEKIESMDTHSRVTHSYSVEITGNGTTIRPNVWAGDRWIIRYNLRNKRKECTYSAIVQFVKKYQELRISDYEKDIESTRF